MVAARELPIDSLTKNESLSDDVIDRLNAMSELRHPSIIQVFGVVNPDSMPTLVSTTLPVCVVGENSIDLSSHIFTVIAKLRLSRALNQSYPVDLFYLTDINDIITVVLIIWCSLVV